jgi:hypothetical protein
MRTVLIAFVGLIASTCGTVAEDAACSVADHLVTADFRLPQVATAIANKNLNIAVIGSASSTLVDPSLAKKAYPAQLEAALVEKLPGVAVKVTTYVKSREGAADMEKHFPQVLAADKPALVVWQTGTVEAIRRTDVDEFRTALDDGIDVLHAGPTDVILMNMQYSPRTELMMSGKEYAEAMRFAALQHEIPLFDRFAIMHHWGEIGTFDLNEITKKTDTAVRVHGCIGRLLARLIIDATQLQTPTDHAIR